MLVQISFMLCQFMSKASSMAAERQKQTDGSLYVFNFVYLINAHFSQFSAPKLLELELNHPHSTSLKCFLTGRCYLTPCIDQNYNRWLNRLFKIIQNSFSTDIKWHVNNRQSQLHAIFPPALTPTLWAHWSPIKTQQGAIFMKRTDEEGSFSFAETAEMFPLSNEFLLPQKHSKILMKYWWLCLCFSFNWWLLWLTANSDFRINNRTHRK